MGWDMLVVLFSADLTWHIQRLLGLDRVPRELVQRSAREAVCEARHGSETEVEPYVVSDEFFARIVAGGTPDLVETLREWGEVAMPLTVRDYCLVYLCNILSTLVAAWDADIPTAGTPLVGEGRLETRIEIRAHVGLKEACRTELDNAGARLSDWDMNLPNEADAVAFVYAIFCNRTAAALLRALTPPLTAEEITTLRRWSRSRWGSDMDHCFPVLMDALGQ